VTARTAGRLALLVVLAAVWSAAAYFLWSSQVPSSLRLEHVDVHRLFPAAQLHAASSSARFTTLV